MFLFRERGPTRAAALAVAAVALFKVMTITADTPSPLSALASSNKREIAGGGSAASTLDEGMGICAAKNKSRVVKCRLANNRRRMGRQQKEEQ